MMLDEGHELHGHAAPLRTRLQPLSERALPDECDPNVEAAEELRDRVDHGLEVLLRGQSPDVEDVLDRRRNSAQPVRCHARRAAKAALMTNDRLTLAQVVLLATYAVGMSGGQVLFKLAAQRFPASAEVGEQLTSLLGNTYFFVAFAFYCTLAICWVWILTFTPLSRAYPFVALAFAITPLLGGWLFDEPINLRLALGIAAIVFGLVLVVG